MKIKPITRSEVAKANSVNQQVIKRARAIFKLHVDFGLITITGKDWPNKGKALTYNNLKNGGITVTIKTPESHGVKDISVDLVVHGANLKGLGVDKDFSYLYKVSWKLMSMDNKELKTMLAHKGFIKKLKS